MAVDMKRMVEDFDGMLEAVTGDDDNRGYIVVADDNGDVFGSAKGTPIVIASLMVNVFKSLPKEYYADLWIYFLRGLDAAGLATEIIGEEGQND
jgi:hypothetical protein